MSKFLLITDTPGIKQFVFGSDALAEMRGASALLDDLSRSETELVLRDSLNSHGGQIATVYSNAGTGQFVVTADRADDVQAAAVELSRRVAKATGGEMRTAYGIAAIQGQGPDAYRQAVSQAYLNLRRQRETGSGRALAGLMPLMMECNSLAYMPVEHRGNWGGENRLVCQATFLKREEARTARRGGRWAEWMERLAASGPWPKGNRRLDLRPSGFDGIGAVGRKPGYFGLVYADGNAMGQLVQDLDSVETARLFSEIVDGSIREACYGALEAALSDDIEQARQAEEAGDRLPVLPADILLLGGDDMLVALPADRAISFAADAARRFEQRARQTIDERDSGGFFRSRLPSERGPTISCGVSIGQAKYPFYLLLDLVEGLLKNAKQAGADVRSRTNEPSNPAMIDFHLVAGSSQHELEAIRKSAYHIESPRRRTCRPYLVDAIGTLEQAVHNLRDAGFPRSKLHALSEALLTPSAGTAEYLAIEIFSRCSQRHRQELWNMIAPLGTLDRFPWCRRPGEDGLTSPVADIVEAYDLFA